LIHRSEEKKTASFDTQKDTSNSCSEDVSFCHPKHVDKDSTFIALELKKSKSGLI
jgi:hypothetical protein